LDFLSATTWNQHDRFARPRAEETGFDLASAFPAIDAWRERVANLPGWKPPYEMMPVGNSMPLRG